MRGASLSRSAIVMTGETPDWEPRVSCHSHLMHNMHLRSKRCFFAAVCGGLIRGSQRCAGTCAPHRRAVEGLRAHRLYLRTPISNLGRKRGHRRKDLPGVFPRCGQNAGRSEVQPVPVKGPLAVAWPALKPSARLIRGLTGTTVPQPTAEFCGQPHVLDC